jgi:hypothetical protein
MMIYFKRTADPNGVQHGEETMEEEHVTAESPPCPSDAASSGSDGAGEPRQVTVRIRTDDPEAAERLAARLEVLGIHRTQVQLSERLQTFRVDGGRWPSIAQGRFVGAVRTAVLEALDLASVDAESFPLGEVSSAREEITVAFPIAAARDGRLRPYAGPRPARFDIQVLCPDAAVGDGVAEALRAAGFQVSTKVGPSSPGIVTAEVKCRSRPA